MKALKFLQEAMRTVLQTESVNPVGVIQAYYGEVPPKNYLFCDGSEFDKDEYPELYALLGDNHTPEKYSETAPLERFDTPATNVVAPYDGYVISYQKNDGYVFNYINDIFVGATGPTGNDVGINPVEFYLKKGDTIRIVPAMSGYARWYKEKPCIIRAKP